MSERSACREPLARVGNQQLGERAWRVEVINERETQGRVRAARASRVRALETRSFASSEMFAHVWAGVNEYFARRVFEPLPLKGASPTSRMKRMHPHAHRSTGSACGSPLILSGAIYLRCFRLGLRRMDTRIRPLTRVSRQHCHQFVRPHAQVAQHRQSRQLEHPHHFHTSSVANSARTAPNQSTPQRMPGLALHLSPPA